MPTGISMIVWGAILQVCGLATSAIGSQVFAQPSSGDDRFVGAIILIIGIVMLSTGSLMAAAGIIRWGVQPLISQTAEILELLKAKKP
jgi:hypothetical protein